VVAAGPASAHAARIVTSRIPPLRVLRQVRGKPRGAHPAARLPSAHRDHAQASDSTLAIWPRRSSTRAPPWKAERSRVTVLFAPQGRWLLGRPRSRRGPPTLDPVLEHMMLPCIAMRDGESSIGDGIMACLGADCP